MEIFSTESLALLIKAVGYIGLFAIVFAESGLFIGFFLPGDSLLFVSGILAHQGYLNIYWLLPVVFIAAVLGDNFGYAFGRKVGHRIFNKEESLFFNKDNLEKARLFYEKHGPMAIVLARFTPVIRTFAPILAGVGKMDYRKFFIYNISGGFAWSFLCILSGYFLGELIPNIDHYIIPIVLGIIIVSIIPSGSILIREKIRKIKRLKANAIKRGTDNSQ